MTEISCHLCSGTLAKIDGYEELGRVTSDCRPWPAGGKLAVCRVCGTVQKPTDAAWRKEIAEIYDSYDIYSQSGGKEQKVFNAGTGISRSAVLLDAVATAIPAGKAGRLLDVGCGNGELLANAARRLPGWRLSGTELSDRHRAAIEKIPGVEGFHTGPNSLDQAPGPFDAVTLVHCLEHIPDPAAILSALREKLAPDGHLVVEVPHFRDNPFDLLIVDHCSHFSAAGLRRLAERAGFAADLLRSDLIPKELSMIAHAAEAREAAIPLEDGAAAARAVAWLAGLRGQVESCAAHGSLGLFGTAIAGQWLFGCFPDEVAFFVDEDPDRVGRECNGRPILSPDQVPENARVFVPLAPKVAASVCARLGAAYIEPLPFPAA